MKSASFQGLFLLLLLSFSPISCAAIGGGSRHDSGELSSELDDDDVRSESRKAEEAKNDKQADAKESRNAEGGGIKETRDQLGSWRSVVGNTTSMSELTSANTPVYTPKVSRSYRNPSRVTRDDFIDQSQDEGSLWASNGQTNYYFTKNRVRNPGDLITLILDEELFRDVLAEAKRTLNYPEMEQELKLAQDKITEKFIADRLNSKSDEVSTSAAAPESAPSSGSSPKPNASTSPASSDAAAKVNRQELIRELTKMAPRAKPVDVDIAKSLEFKTGDSMMAEILERYPNGNYRIRAFKKVGYKNGSPRFVSLIGVVRNSDIGDDNDTVHSGRLYEYRVEVAH